MNLLALNLAHEIATGRRSVEDAREFYPKAVMAHLEKEPTPYTQKLQFAAQRGSADPDKTTIDEDMLARAARLKQTMLQEDKEKAAAGGTPR